MQTELERHLAPFIRRSGRRPLILGHRGAKGGSPDNSLTSFEEALAQGADGVELDVRMSADGVLVLSHDDEISVIDDKQAKRSLSRLSFAQIEKLKTKSGAPLATLREALTFQARSGCFLNIELKGDVPAPAWMARKAAEEINAHGGDNILLSSFSPVIVKALRRFLPDIPCSLIFSPEHWWMRRFLPLKALGVQGANPKAQLLDSTLLRRIRAGSTLVGTWTVNSPDEARRLADLGVDLIISDAPGTIVNALKGG